VAVDDPRLDALWAKAGELGVPVLIHTAEPASFFQPVDRYNERWLELTQYPARARPPEQYPTFDAVIAEQHRVFRRHPRTQFVAAHLGWLGHDLARLGATLDSMPNMSVDLAAVIYEIGRQPRYAREFLTRYQDRVLFGKDIYSLTEYHTYFRVLETEDDYFDYYRKRHAFWKMYGVGLPDSVLRKIYFDNARRLIPRIGDSGSR
jgi:predicted TIM-barrel fold metal-dependent hydrolase